MRGHGPQVAAPVRRWPAGRAEGRPAKRAPAGVHRRKPGRGRRAGMRAARRVWRAAIEVELARELAARCQVAASASTICRWLASDALKPWQHRSWISGRDPGFAVKAARVLDLYAGIWDGEPLGSNDYVICADEKTSIQARCRCRPTLPPGKARAMRVEHDYKRGGALARLAAWDVRRGRVTGRCEHTTGIAPFSRLVGQVMTAEPYASADRVFWIWSSGPAPRWLPCPAGPARPRCAGSRRRNQNRRRPSGRSARASSAAPRSRFPGVISSHRTRTSKLAAMRTSA